MTDTTPDPKWPPAWFASAEGDGSPLSAHAKELLWTEESEQSVRRGVLLALAAGVLAVVISMLIILLLPGSEPCMQWDGWRFVTTFPRPDGCGVGE